MGDKKTLFREWALAELVSEVAVLGHMVGASRFERIFGQKLDPDELIVFNQMLDELARDLRTLMSQKGVGGAP